MNIQSPSNRRRRAAFTLIEMLVVFGVIAILVALIVAGSGYAWTKARLSRAQAEMKSLETAIDTYKNKTGSYPPDNPANPALSPLFYELTGTVISTDPNGAPKQYYSPVSGETFVVANNDFGNVYGSNVVGFANANADSSQVQNFIPSVSKSGFTGKMPIGATTNTYTFIGLQVTSPLQVKTVDGKIMAPWSYKRTNPDHNPDSYDLWVDISAGGKTYRISNWSKDPQPL